jgi:hypothetical protein
MMLASKINDARQRQATPMPQNVGLITSVPLFTSYAPLPCIMKRKGKKEIGSRPCSDFHKEHTHFTSFEGLLCSLGASF